MSACSLSLFREKENETERKDQKPLSSFFYTLLSFSLFPLSLSSSPNANTQPNEIESNKKHKFSLSMRPDPQVEPPLQPVGQSALQPERPDGRVDPDPDADPGPGTRFPAGAGRVPGHRRARLEVRAHVGEQAPFQRPPPTGKGNSSSAVASA